MTRKCMMDFFGEEIISIVCVGHKQWKIETTKWRHRRVWRGIAVTIFSRYFNPSMCVCTNLLMKLTCIRVFCSRPQAQFKFIEIISLPCHVTTRHLMNTLTHYLPLSLSLSLSILSLRLLLSGSGDVLDLSSSLLNVAKVTDGWLVQTSICLLGRRTFDQAPSVIGMHERKVFGLWSIDLSTTVMSPSIVLVGVVRLSSSSTSSLSLLFLETDAVTWVRDKDCTTDTVDCIDNYTISSVIRLRQLPPCIWRAIFLIHCRALMKSAKQYGNPRSPAKAALSDDDPSTQGSGMCGRPGRVPA